ncbi:trpB, partial [Symbiodinium sp. CCMP2456]
MKLLGAEVRPVTTGSRTLRDAINEAMRDWMSSVEDTHYILGSVVGPHPFPRIVRDFQAVIGDEAREQSLERLGKLPNKVVACVGGGSNAAGMFYPFVEDKEVELIGVEAGGRGPNAGDHASPLTYGEPGVLHGSYSFVMQDEDGQTCDVHSMSAGLDYPGVGPEHSYWKATGRVEYTCCEDDDAMKGFDALAASEGILPALESSHAVAKAMEVAAKMSKDEVVLVCLSGRGDKADNLMSAVDRAFENLRQQNKKALVPFVTAGDPSLEITAAALTELGKRGAAVCEVGIPYSDPIADGPVIQASYTRALDKKIKLKSILDTIGSVTPTLPCPVVTMISYAIIHRHGPEQFLDAAQAAGVSGAIVPDLLVEESDAFAKLCKQRDFSLIQLVTPTTSKERAKKIVETSTGFIYY